MDNYKRTNEHGVDGKIVDYGGTVHILRLHDHTGEALYFVTDHKTATLHIFRTKEAKDAWLTTTDTSPSE